MRRVRDAAGLTLVEVLIAVTILATIVVLMASALRVGARAWEAGEKRAAAQQELRAIVELLTDVAVQRVPVPGPGRARGRSAAFSSSAKPTRCVS